MFKGSLPALVTPFTPKGDVDIPALKKLVEWHIAEGSHGLVPVGTTGESPTLSHDEHRQVVEEVIATVAGRVPVIAGAGSNSTHEGIGLVQHAQAAGADAALVVDGGIYRHDFVAAAVVQGLMQAGLETGVPVLSVSLTPHHYQETDHHTAIFRDHFVQKGREAAHAALAIAKAREAIG